SFKEFLKNLFSNVLHYRFICYKTYMTFINASSLFNLSRGFKKVGLHLKTRNQSNGDKLR
ncbi:MAG TPA: hypothetical protein VKA10_08890, partial [Prolixibacteraceae bacterium]|nr:hypothetical protein [Prolixibacteraceae bacterium]